MDVPAVWDHVDPDRPSLPALVQGTLKGPESLLERPVAVTLNGVVATSVRPHRTSGGDIRIAALLPERLFRAGLNQVDVFLVSERGSAWELEHVERPLGFVYELSWGEPGEGDWLLRDSRSALSAEVERIPVVRNDAGLIGYLEGSHREAASIHGWAVDLTGPGSVQEVVAFLAGRQYWIGSPQYERTQRRRSLRPGTPLLRLHAEVPSRRRARWRIRGRGLRCDPPGGHRRLRDLTPGHRHSTEVLLRATRVRRGRSRDPADQRRPPTSRPSDRKRPRRCDRPNHKAREAHPDRGLGGRRRARRTSAPDRRLPRREVPPKHGRKPRAPGCRQTPRRPPHPAHRLPRRRPGRSRTGDLCRAPPSLRSDAQWLRRRVATTGDAGHWLVGAGAFSHPSRSARREARSPVVLIG